MTSVLLTFDVEKKSPAAASLHTPIAVTCWTLSYLSVSISVVCVCVPDPTLEPVGVNVEIKAVAETEAVEQEEEDDRPYYEAP